MPRVLNNGYVELIECMGGDDAVIRSARRCWRSASKGEDSDRKLIRHLIRLGHKTPFEAVVFSFDVKAPLFVARQWFRHRIASYNEESLRYCVALKDYYLPENLSPEWRSRWEAHHEEAFDLYHALIEQEQVPKEQARSVLPLGIYTRFYWTVNGSSLMNFLRLRLASDAQPEIRAYAAAVCNLVQLEAPVCFDEFQQEVLAELELR